MDHPEGTQLLHEPGPWELWSRVNCARLAWAAIVIEQLPEFASDPDRLSHPIPDEARRSCPSFPPTVDT